MTVRPRLSDLIDETNGQFTTRIKTSVLSRVATITTEKLEWLVMEHYQFSFANCRLLTLAMNCTVPLDEKGVSDELRRNLMEEDGHAPMYKKGMFEVGTDVERRVPFAPTSRFLEALEALSTAGPSRALGAIYATETAAIFEHQLLNEICKEICVRRAVSYEGSLIQHFHFIHLDGGVEQGHKDGLAVFVEKASDSSLPASGPIVREEVLCGAFAAIAAMAAWWDALLTVILKDD